MDCKKYYDTVGEVEDGNKYTLMRFEQTFPYLLKSGKLLDVGCGEGYWLNFLMKTDLDISGLDISSVRLEVAKRNTKGRDIPLYLRDIRYLQFDDEEFDQVTALEVLEHIPEWKEALSEILRVSSKRVVITVPYKEKIVYETCKACGIASPHSGHLHSFCEDDFRNLDIGGRVRFANIASPFGLSYYTKIGANFILRKTRNLISNNGHKSGGASILCTNCYEKMPLMKYRERGYEIARRILDGSPSHLLVQIDKLQQSDYLYSRNSPS